MNSSRLRVVRLTWWVLVPAALVVSVVSWPVYFARLNTVCEVCLITPDFAANLNQIGFSVTNWAFWNVGMAMLLTLGWGGMGLLIYARRSDDYRAVLMSALLVLVAPGFGGLSKSLAEVGPVWSLLVKVISFLSGPCFFGLILTLPNGRLAPRWTLWLLLYVTVVFAPNSFFPGSPFAFGTWSPAATAIFIVLPLLGSLLFIPVYRFWRVFTPTERQQTKWAVIGFLVAAAGIIATVVVSIPYVNASTPSLQLTIRGDVAQGIGYGLSPLMIPLFIGVAVLRYRLFDIDVIIRRTLVYAVLTGLLALTYFGSVVVLQNIFSALTGQRQSTLVTVLSTLAIVRLIVPLRARVQAVIDRRLYRRKYDAAQTVTQFGATLRDEVDLGQLSEHLVAVVQDTMQPATVGLWLRPNPSGPASRSAAFGEEQP